MYVRVQEMDICVDDQTTYDRSPVKENKCIVTKN